MDAISRKQFGLQAIDGNQEGGASGPPGTAHNLLHRASVKWRGRDIAFLVKPEVGGLFSSLRNFPSPISGDSWSCSGLEVLPIFIISEIRSF